MLLVEVIKWPLQIAHPSFCVRLQDHVSVVAIGHLPTIVLMRGEVVDFLPALRHRTL